MKILCDIGGAIVTDSHRLAWRGWRIYEGTCDGFVSHDDFYGGRMVHVSKAIDAERIVAACTRGMRCKND